MRPSKDRKSFESSERWVADDIQRPLLIRQISDCSSETMLVRGKQDNTLKMLKRKGGRKGILYPVKLSLKTKEWKIRPLMIY